MCLVRHNKHRRKTAWIPCELIAIAHQHAHHIRVECDMQMAGVAMWWTCLLWSNHTSNGIHLVKRGPTDPAAEAFRVRILDLDQNHSRIAVRWREKVSFLSQIGKMTRMIECRAHIGCKYALIIVPRISDIDACVQRILAWSVSPYSIPVE